MREVLEACGVDGVTAHGDICTDFSKDGLDLDEVHVGDAKVQDMDGERGLR